MNNNYFYKYFSTKKDYPNLNKLFNIQAQLDDTNTSEAIIDAIEESKDLFIEKAKISVKYSFYNLDKINADNIIVSDDTASSYILTGNLLPLILKDCHQVILYTLTLNGYDEIIEECDDDILLSFFCDAWGSAYAESADSYFIETIRSEYQKNNLYMTISHNPGQHLFPLKNQQTFFEALNPADIGLTLTESCLMLPSKSISGIVGVSTNPQDTSKVSCDFCNMKNSCPTAYAHKSPVNLQT